MGTNIPQHLFDSQSGNPHRYCLMCETDVIETAKNYTIEKIIKRYQSLELEECIFEHCICTDCAENAWKELSESSRKRVEAYLFTQTSAIRRVLEKQMSGEGEPLHFGRCAFKGIPKEACATFQIIVHCKGDQVELNKPAFMISDVATEEMSDLLSEESKGYLDDFMDEHFGLPPELKGKPILLF